MRQKKKPKERPGPAIVVPPVQPSSQVTADGIIDFMVDCLFEELIREVEGGG